MPALLGRYREHYQSNLLLAYPVIISQLGHTVVGLADSLIVGHKGALPLAAVSLGNSVFTVLMMIGIGISFGLTPLIAQASGKKAHHDCGTLLSNSLVVNSITGVVLCLLTFVVISVLGQLHEPREVVVLAKPFMAYLAISVMPLMIFLTFKQFAEGLGFTKQAMRISIAGNVINIGVGIVLVFGLFGFPSMGIIGVGISTLVDRFLMALAMGFYVLKGKRFKPFLDAFSWAAVRWRSVVALLHIGVPVSMQYFFEVSAFTFSAVMIGWTGAIPLAAHQIAISLAAVTYMMASGLASAATIQAGNSFGQQNFGRMRFAAVSSYHLVLVFMSFTAIMFIALRSYLPLLYIKDPRVVSLASSLILIAAFFQLFDGFQVVGLGILRGMSDVRVPTLLTFVAYWIIGLPLAYILGIRLGWGAIGVWIGLGFGLGMAAVLLLLRFLNKTTFYLSQVVE